jgi:hypothetical protein
MKTGWSATQIGVTAATWVVFAVVAVWGLVPLAWGQTLTEILAGAGGFGRLTAAALISSVVAFLGTTSLVISSLPLGGGGAQGESIAGLNHPTHFTLSEGCASPATEYC